MDSPTANATHRSTEEFKAAYGKLSEADKRKLMAIAHAYARCARAEPDDMLQAAFVPVLDGTRPWPVGLDLVPFLRGVMRSVASGHIRWRARSAVRTPVSLFGADGESVIDKADDAANPEEAMMWAQEHERIGRDLAALMVGDEAAAYILMGMMDGMEGEPLRELTGLGEKEFASKRRWVRRRINAYLEERAHR